MANLTHKQSALLKPWAELYARLNERIENLPDDDLEALVDAVSAATTTNCWCMTYAAAQLLKPVIAQEHMSRVRTRNKQTA